jgi:hypothetical protein
MEEIAAQSSMEEKLSDFEYMYKVLEENYPFFEVNNRLSGIDWLANKEKYINIIKATKTDDEYLSALDRILNDLNNGHTQIIRKDFYSLLKAALEPDEALWKPWLEQMNMQSAGLRYSDSGNKSDKVGSIAAANNIITNNVQTKLLVESKVAYLGVGSFNTFNIEEDMKIISAFLQSIRDYDALIIDIRQNGGGSSHYWSDYLVPMLINDPIKWNAYFIYRGGEFSEPFISSKLQEDYKKLKPIQELEKEKLLKVPPEIWSNYKYYYKLEEVISPKNSINFKGKIYLLVDRNVYSSSEMLAAFTKSTGFATIIGEKTGGDGIGQDPLICTLPSTGFVLRFPLVMGLTFDGSCNDEHKTEPDIAVLAEKQSDISKDYAIQYVLDLYK